MHITKIFDTIKDILFPIYCLQCGREGSFVCNNCLKALDCSGVFYCPVCHASSMNGAVCTTCSSSLDRHIAIMKYKEQSLIGNILHTFKYAYAEDVKVILDTLIQKFFSHYNIDVDIIIPVPLHRKRYVERGFNQSEIIAQFVGHKIQKPIHDVLIRTRHTIQQAKLNREDRLKNLKGAFSIKNNVDMRGKRILLIDDVLTTGSTMGECARVLKDSGAREVVGFSIARG